MRDPHGPQMVLVGIAKPVAPVGDDGDEPVAAVVADTGLLPNIILWKGTT